MTFLTSGRGRRLELLRPGIQGRDPLLGQSLRLPRIETPRPAPATAARVPGRPAAARGCLPRRRGPLPGGLSADRAPAAGSPPRESPGSAAGTAAPAAPRPRRRARRRSAAPRRPRPRRPHIASSASPPVPRPKRSRPARPPTRPASCGFAGRARAVTFRSRGLFLGLVGIQVDQGPARQFGLDRRFFDLGVQFPARPAPRRAHADQHRLAVRRRPPPRFRQARQPRQGSWRPPQASVYRPIGPRRARA